MSTRGLPRRVWGCGGAAASAAFGVSAATPSFVGFRNCWCCWARRIRSWTSCWIRTSTTRWGTRIRQTRNCQKKVLSEMLKWNERSLEICQHRKYDAPDFAFDQLVTKIRSERSGTPRFVARLMNAAINLVE